MTKKVFRRTALRVTLGKCSKRAFSKGIWSMPIIRIPEAHWGKVWRSLVASGPVSRVSQDPVYVVSERQLRLLRRKKLPFELVSPSNGRIADKTHG